MRIALMGCAAAIFLILLFSCGTRDDRDEIRARNGEPDNIAQQGRDFRWRELWFYNSAGVGYEFRRTSGCGSTSEVYLYTSFFFTPPDSSGIKPQLPGTKNKQLKTDVTVPKDSKRIFSPR